MINCVAIDDDRLARNLLASYIEKVPTLNLLGTFYNPMDILPLLNEDKIQLIFIDIQMPDISGIDFLKSVEVKPKVILTTAYAEYALEGYELEIVDYLLKPFSFERFLKAVQKTERILDNEKRGQTSAEEQTITLAADHKLYKILLGDIIYIEGMREYVRYHLTDSRKIMVLQSMKGLEDSLPSGDFVRIHKSFIVSIKKATILEGNMIHIGGLKLPVGNIYREKVRDLFK